MSFASLPYEIRSRIWPMAIEPRRLTVLVQKSDASFSKKQRDKRMDVLYETTSTPAPALMHVCHESRQLAPYKRAFTTGTEPRWTWVNFEMDIFCLFSVHGDITSHHREIQRLELRTDKDHDWYESVTNFQSLSFLEAFVNLRELRIVMGRHDWMWGDEYAFESLIGRCPMEKIRFLNEASGILLTAPQLKLVSDWHDLYTFDRRGHPSLPTELSEWIEFLEGSWYMTLEQMYEVD